MYAIIGVTGHVGRVVANILLDRNLPVRAIIRNRAKAQEWLDKGAEVAIAELHDAVALAEAFKGTEGVFVMTPPLLDSANPMADHDLMLAAISEAIEVAQPKKVVYLSSIGAQHNQGTGAIKKLYDMEQAFSKLNIPSAGIRAAWFMENFTGSIPYVKESGKLPSFLNPTGYAIPMIASKDIGKLAADLLLQNRIGHRIVELEGPCQYSADDVAMVLSYHLKTTVSVQVIPEEQYAATYQSFGFTLPAAELMAEMNLGFNKQWIVFEGGETEHVTGETLMEDVLRDYIN
jgi:NAD(P)H dehydrogenase (quinone)